MKASIRFILVTCSVFVSTVSSYPTYVPESACQTMLPGHGAKPQNSFAPYKVEVSPRVVRRGDVVQVVLAGSQPFQGFYVQARSPDGTPIGTFIRSDVVKTHNCNGGLENAAFHGIRGHKQDQEIFWKAPTDYEGQVTFFATFVQDFETLWTFVRANPITVKGQLRRFRSCRSSSTSKGRHPNSVFAKLETKETSDISKNDTLEIVPRILNRTPKVQDSEQSVRYPGVINIIPSANREISRYTRKDPQEIAETFPSFTQNGNSIQGHPQPDNYYSTQLITSPSLTASSVGSNSQNARPHVANFHFSQAELPSSLFPMQINHRNTNNKNVDGNTNYHSRNENKISHQRQLSPSTFPYKLEYNGRGHQPQVNAFSLPSSYYSYSTGSPLQKIKTGGTSVQGFGSGVGRPGKRKTVWIMDDRFQNFKDVDELFPVTRPLSVSTHLSKENYYSPGVGYEYPIVDPGSSHFENPYTTHVSTTPPFQTIPVLGNRVHGLAKKYTHPQFPSYGYLVHNLKSDDSSSSRGTEPPFYLIPASKHDVDNLHAQYFTHRHYNPVLAAGHTVLG